MNTQFSRTELLIGSENVEKLKSAKIAVFGIGGVGSYVVEGLSRAGVGHLVLVDADTVDVTNINRQIIATNSTVGMDKVEVAKKRVLDINPNIRVDAKKILFNNTTEDFLDGVDYIVDAIDMVSSKIELVKRAKEKNIPIISCMGTGNKLDPTKFEVTDISKTTICPLAKVMRKELKKLGISNLKVLYSKEEPIKVEELDGKRVPASISFVPSVAGLIIAGEVIKDIIK